MSDLRSPRAVRHLLACLLATTLAGSWATALGGEVAAPSPPKKSFLQKAFEEGQLEGLEEARQGLESKPAPRNADPDGQGSREIARWVCGIPESGFADLTPELEKYADFAPAKSRLQDVVALRASIVQLFGGCPGVVPKSPATRREIEQRADALKLALEDFSRKFASGREGLKGRLARPTALVVSGGVSLGSYQAGFLHYYSQFLLQHADYVKTKLGLGLSDEALGRFELATGASAGSINAFLAMLASCREQVREPEQSLFYRTWIPVGMGGLFNPRDITADGLLSRQPIEDAILRIQGLWSNDPKDGRWSGRGCRGVIGMSVTPIHAREIELQPIADPTQITRPPRLKVRRQSEKFMLEVVDVPGSGPRFKPFRPAVQRSEEGPLNEFYPVFGDGDLNRAMDIAEVAQLLKASSSFPLAFRPVSLRYTVVGQDGKPEGEPRTESFIDGGVFDNTPLRLAIRMHEWMKRKGMAKQQEPWLLFAEPDAIGWSPRSVRASAPDSGKPTLFQEYLPFLGSFVQASREAELMETMESEPTLSSSLVVPARQMPVASGQLLNFLGFFEEDFRIFDFYLGMVDAWEHLSLHLDQFQIMQADGLELPVDSEVFRCFLDHRKLSDHDRKDLDPIDVPSCAELSGAQSTSKRNLVRLLRAARDLKAYTRSSDYDPDLETEKFFELLGRYEFQFRDFQYQGKPIRHDQALLAIRETLQVAIHRLGQHQGTLGAKVGIWTVGKALANELLYRQPVWSGFVGIQLDRGVELGLSRRLFGGPLLATVGARVFQFDRLLLDEGTREGFMSASLMPFAGLGADIPLYGQARLDLGLGYGVLFRESWSPIDHLMLRHGPEGMVGISLFQRLYLDVGGTYFLDDCAGNNSCANVSPQHQSHPFPLTTHRSEGRVGIGWRTLLD